ncbi:suppressor of fused domain protein [Alteromonas sp. a30]|uniref:suppressor of fused domain protein n=1 Tax=Alteromonas sp. a30 TaxID=2730917 RepID=UPI002281A515|nr:suppressor of fused domain protein [Alteromonas sp. a30]MCY7296903.1 suppressor of fused domain protein [Alteromonas sp. a30]
MTFLQHVERYLGSIGQGWKDDKANGDALQIVSFSDCPGETVSTFLSLGVQKHELAINQNKSVRLEFVFSMYTTDDVEPIVSMLMSVCESVIARHRAVLRGELIPFDETLKAELGFCGLYCTIPLFFDEDFIEFTESSPSTVIVWLVPVYQNEADFLAERGWSLFEDLLEEHDPDLCSLERVSII